MITKAYITELKHSGNGDFITDLNSDKSLDRIELSNQQLESELSKLRTLVLDQKTVDSLHNSKTDVESLNKK